jgi:hypothetical protein
LMSELMNGIGEWLGGESAGVSLSPAAKRGATGVALEFGKWGKKGESVEGYFNAAFKRMEKEGGGAVNEEWYQGYRVWASGGAKGAACKDEKETDVEWLGRAYDELRDEQAETRRKVDEFVGCEEFSVEVVERLRAECKAELKVQREEFQAKLSEVSDTLRVALLKVDELLGKGTVIAARGGGSGGGGGAGGARARFVNSSDRVCFKCKKVGHEHKDCLGDKRG